MPSNLLVHFNEFSGCGELACSTHHSIAAEVLGCRAVLEMLKTGLRPSDIMSKAAFRNAITVVMALGGSTNAVLHFLAIARAVGVELTLDDFQVSICCSMALHVLATCTV